MKVGDTNYLKGRRKNQPACILMQYGVVITPHITGKALPEHLQLSSNFVIDDDQNKKITNDQKFKMPENS